jgi:hypothetical protein
MQAEQILHISLYLKHPTSYVRCLWSPLLGSRGVLGWPGITVLGSCASGYATGPSYHNTSGPVMTYHHIKNGNGHGPKGGSI